MDRINRETMDAAGWLKEGIRQAGERAMPLAIECWEKGRTLDPGNPEILLHLGDAYLGKSKFSRARACFEALAARHPDWNDGAAAKALERLAKEYASLQESIAACRNMLRYDNMCAEAFYNLARCHQSLGEYEDAVFNFQDAGNFGWDADDVFYGLGCVRQEMGDFREAVKNFNQAIKANPKMDWAWHAKAWCLRCLGRRKEALAAVEKYLALNPRLTGTCWLKATILAEIAARNKRGAN